MKCNFGLITQSILKLENASVLLDESLEIIENTKFKFSQNKEPIAKNIDKKLQNVLEKYTEINVYDRNILNGNNLEDFSNITPG